LLQLYAAGDVCFVGGSLVPVGGHNLLEPAVFKKPILSGPYLQNFTAVRDLLLDGQGLVIVDTATQLAEQVLNLFNNPEQVQQSGERAYQVIERNRGAVARHLELAKQLL